MRRLATSDYLFFVGGFECWGGGHVAVGGGVVDACDVVLCVLVILIFDGVLWRVGTGGGIDLGVDDRLRPVDARGDDALPYFRRQLLSLGGEGTTEICLTVPWTPG